MDFNNDKLCSDISSIKYGNNEIVVRIIYAIWYNDVWWRIIIVNASIIFKFKRTTWISWVCIFRQDWHINLQYNGV